MNKQFIYRLGLYLTLAFFSILMVRITVPYFNFDLRTGFLAIKQSYIDNPVWVVAFYIHVITSCFLLIAGFTQFSNRFLNVYPKLHRKFGKFYVFMLLCLSGPAGFIMALLANGGIYSRIGFTLLSVLWLVFTVFGWYYAVKRNFEKHRIFMIRSFALTISALTLRLWKLLIVLAFAPNPMDVYRIVAWLGWIPNLLFAEWIIRRYKARNKSKAKL